MIRTEAFSEFKQALTRLRDNDPDRALAHMRRAVELEGQNPFYLSYLGVLKTRVERKWTEAEQLCQAALRMKHDDAQLYVNLAEVYVAAGRSEDAVETLYRGLKNAPRDPRLHSALGKIVSRRPPVISFLPRQSFLNRKLGKLRHRALQYFANS